MKTLLIAAALALPALGFAADAPAPQGLDRLTVFAGSWQSNLENYETPYSHAATISSTLVNQCWKAGAFFMCNLAANGESRVLLVFTYKGGDSYGVTFVPADGSHAVNGSLIVAGGVWTFPGQSTKLGQTVYFRTVNMFSDLNNYDYREEFSTDQLTWTLMSKGHVSRVKN